MVTGFFPGGAIVQAEAGLLLCGIVKTFRAPEGSSALAVGDFVTVALTRQQHRSTSSADDKDRADGMILARQPRSTVLVRPQPRSAKRFDKHQTPRIDKVLVANMDQLLIVTSVRQPPLRPAVVDRYLIVAERGELVPLLVINKIDLGMPEESTVMGFIELGLKLVLCSAMTGEGLEDIAGRPGWPAERTGGGLGRGQEHTGQRLHPRRRGGHSTGSREGRARAAHHGRRVHLRPAATGRRRDRRYARRARAGHRPDGRPASRGTSRSSTIRPPLPLQ